MYLREVHIRQFRNYSAADAVFSPAANCFVGLNGSGKTNMLDAIYYLSLTKSYFQPVDQLCILHGEEFFSLQASFVKGAIEQDVRVTVQKGGRKSVKVNNNEHRRLSEHIGMFPLVIITPGDIMLIHEASAERRKFLDGLISQIDKVYLADLLAYNRLIEQRNRQLRLFAEMNFFDRILLESYNNQIVKLGTAIHEKRKALLLSFVPVFATFYNGIAPGKERVDLDYISDLHERDFASLIIESESNDLAAQRTTKGIHKEDIEFVMNGFPLKKFGSQGQQKSFVIAMKLAQYAYLEEKTGIKPLLLLDDIFEKLDEERIEKLLHMAGEQAFGQIFITDTHIERLKAVLGRVPGLEVKYFGIREGIIDEL